ncbi:MAG: hypothetical protein ACK5Z4_00190 [Planctomyces sp.]
MRIAVCSLIVLAGLATAANAQTLTPKTSFGVNGWRAPGVALTGDAPGAVSGSTYLALGTGNNERGLAYNPVTDNLILVTRNGAINATASPFRILNGTTGVDSGGLQFDSNLFNTGTFQYNQVGISDSGEIYIANMSANIRSATSPFRVYKFANESSAPALHYSQPTTGWSSTGGTVRLGDSFDVIGSGANTRILAGFNGVQGYLAINGSTSPTGQIYSSTTAPLPPAGSLPISGAAAGQYRLGLTFGATANDVLAKVAQTNGTLTRSTIGPSGATTLANGGTLTAGGESPMDFAVIGGVPYLATVDANNSRVYMYDMTNPAAPVSLFTFGVRNPGIVPVDPLTGNTVANSNATGSVKFGRISSNGGIFTADLYVLNSNNGIQAFTFSIPTPGAAALLGVGGLAAFRRRR